MQYAEVVIIIVFFSHGWQRTEKNQRAEKKQEMALLHFIFIKFGIGTCSC
jgi:hypothetical protein